MALFSLFWLRPIRQDRGEIPALCGRRSEAGACHCGDWNRESSDSWSAGTLAAVRAPGFLRRLFPQRKRIALWAAQRMKSSIRIWTLKTKSWFRPVPFSDLTRAPDSYWDCDRPPVSSRECTAPPSVCLATISLTPMARITTPRPTGTTQRSCRARITSALLCSPTKLAFPVLITCHSLPPSPVTTDLLSLTVLIF